MKLLTTACAAALSVGLFGAAGAVQAQSYDDIVVFGDSLSDNGNLALFAAQPPPPYFGGRFSNGIVWVEQLGFGPLGGYGDTTDSVDWAFGGAWTSTNPNPPPMTSQVAAYMGSGGTFQSDDVVTLWGGANNIFNNIAAASITPNPIGTMQTVGALAANDIGGMVNTVANAGAGTILVPNLPTLSLTPSFGGGNPAAPLADAGVQGFNTQLLSNLFTQAALHPNANIILMDVNTAGAFLAANATRFGFTNVTSPCFNGVTVCASPGTTFYWDGVHPTTAGHAFIAALATEYLYYGDFAVSTAAEGEAALRHRAVASDSAFTHLGSGAFGDQDRAVISIDYERATIDSRGLMPASDDDSSGFHIQLDHPLSPTLLLGGQFSATRSQVDAGLLKFDSESFSFDAYAGWHSGDGLFINGLIGAGRDNYRDIKRVTMIPTVVNDADTQGLTWSAKLQGGWVFGAGGLSISPRAALGYVHTQVDGYTEDGPMVRQVIADRAIEAVTAEATIRIDGDMGDSVHAFVEAGYRDNIDYNADDVTASLANNPALPLSTEVAEGDGGLALVDAGLTADLSDTFSVGVSYRGRMGDALESHTGRVAVTIRF